MFKKNDFINWRQNLLYSSPNDLKILLVYRTRFNIALILTRLCSYNVNKLNLASKKIQKLLIKFGR